MPLSLKINYRTFPLYRITFSQQNVSFLMKINSIFDTEGGEICRCSTLAVD